MRVRVLGPILAIAVVAALTGGATAQSAPPSAAGSSAVAALPPAPFDPAPPGSIFRWRSGSVVVVGKAADFFVTYTSDGKTKTTSMVGTRDRNYLPAADFTEFTKIWPLEVGKTVRYHRYEPRGGSLSWADEVTVLRTEVVQVGDKRIDTFVVRWSSHGENRSRWEGSFTSWYAPSLGWPVKLSSSDNEGIRYDDQLVGWEPAPR